MFVRESLMVGGKTLTIETGRLAKQASGAVLVTYGESVVLVTAVSTEERPGLDFFPLTCEYLEKTYAEATEHNQRINEYRGDQLYLGQRWMIVAAIATGAAWTAFVANQQLHDEPPQRVVVTELHLDRSQAPMSSKPATPPPPKPEPPPLRDLRQGHVPRPSSTGAAPTRPQR